MNQHIKTNTTEDLFTGGGEMGRLMQSRDWSQTSLGPVSEWPQSLKTCVRIMLTSRQAMFVWWGAELINLYNDAYKAIVGGKHPEALGQPASYVWREIWDQVGPRAESAMLKNEGTYDEALLLIMERFGYPEETYYTFSYSPVPNDQGGTGGIICANTNDTSRIISERQLTLLRELATRTADARTFDEACTLSASCLETNPHDLPFAMIYLVAPDERCVFLTGTCGIGRNHPAVPETVDLDSDSIWPFAEALRTQKPCLVSDLGASFSNLPTGSWKQPPHQAVVMLIAPSGQTGRAGILVAGLNPFRLFDDNYQRFIDLISSQIAASIANAQAYEEERLRAEKLAEIDRVKTIFFSNVSHEFRTPLTLMLGPIEEMLAVADRAKLATQRQQLEMVHRNGLRLLKLVNTLLDFSRIEAGRVQAVYKPTDLAMLTMDLAAVFRSAIEQAGMRLVVDCPSLPESVYVDREMWEKIVLNLLSNAFKFTFEGEIFVSLRYCGKHIELEVRDTGTGIPAAEIPHLFERFHRVQGARGRSYEGSGIGLSLVQELVKLHGGTIDVTSVINQGSSFTVSIPTGYAHLPSDRIEATRSLASTTMGAASYVEEALRWLPLEAREQETTLAGEQYLSSAPVPRTSARILLADDNADMREYVKRLLLGQGYKVEAVGDGVAALAAVSQQIPDLVLTDIMMPELDGLGLLQKLRANPNTREIPIILLSARAGEESRIEGLETGADDYLIKPFSARELLARVEANLKMAQFRTRLYEESQRANRIKDEFLAVLSHELRSPLNPILGWSKLLQTHKFDAARTTQALSIIERNARLQADLINDLLDISRILQGKLSLQVCPVDLVLIIQAAMETVQLATRSKSIQIQTIFEPDVGQILGDSNRLQQVIWNLLSNAVKFTDVGGRVDVRLERIGSDAQIVVSDTGKGISPEFLPYVFDHFRQADAATTRKFGGLGLGLAIVRHLVELHGGTVQAQSPGEGEGATFIVKLPLIASQFKSNQHNQHLEQSLDLNGVKILVVDDDADTREYIAFLLEQYGASVTAVASAGEALLALTQSQPNVLLSDIGMPDMDGYMLMQQVRTLPKEQGGQIQAIALTAYAGEIDYQLALSVGFQRHVSKPVDPVRLVEIITKLVVNN